MRTAELTTLLKVLARHNHWCVSEDTLRAFASESANTFRCAARRHLAAGLLQRVARGLYINPMARVPVHALESLAMRMRPFDALYLSLESALYEHGWISQIPARLTLMTSGRSHVHDTPLGIIEFVHTDVPMCRWMSDVVLDPTRRLHVATPERAFADLKKVGRNLDLVEPA